MSADAAAAAAGAAAAANLPSVKKLNLGANDFIEATIQKKKAEIEVQILLFQILKTWPLLCWK